MNIKKIIKTAAALLMTAAIFTGCNNGLVDDYTAEQNTDGKTVVTFGLTDSSARTVNPAYTVSNLTDIKISYKKAGDAEETVIVSGKKYSDLTGGKYSAELKAGTYNFYATAKVANYSFSATVENKVIAEGSNSVNFNLTKSSAGTADGTGFIDISFTVTDANVKTVKGTLYNYSDSTVKIATKTLTLDSTNPAAKTFSYRIKEGSDIATSIDGGNYRLVLDFYADVAATLKIETYRELVNVSDGLTSSAERTIGNLENVYTITLNLNGGTLAGGVTVPETVTRFSDTVTLPTAAQISKTDAIFCGWYTKEDFSGRDVIELSNFDGNVSLYAKWLHYLTFKGNDAFSLAATKNWTGTIEYSTNKSTWNEWDGNAVNAVASDGIYYIYLRGKNNTTLENSGNRTKFSITGSASSVECNGNIMTLLNWENPDNATMDANCFASLFENCTKLTKAPKLPAMTLSNGCYRNMFSGCSALTAAPELPATILENACYSGMFENCSALTSVQEELPAKTLTEDCYWIMFKGCSSLVNAPDLPATTIAKYSYYEMFLDCSSLKNVPESLPATSVDYEGCRSMFKSCTALETAPALPALTLGEKCYYEMFLNCTALKNAPEVLPAKTLTDSCYEFMFYECTSLVKSPSIAATTMESDCCYGMFRECTSLTTIGKISITNVDKGNSFAEMFMDCSSLKVVETSDADEAFLTINELSDSFNVSNMFANTKSSFNEPEAGKSYKCVVPTPISGSVAISGDAFVSEVLTAAYTPGVEGETVTYQWYRVDESTTPATVTAISGATAATYTLTAADNGKKIKVVVTGSDDYNGTKESALTDTVGPETYLTFKSSESFTLGVTNKAWDGKLYYSTDAQNWTKWTEAATTVDAVLSGGKYYVYLSGNGNTTFYSSSNATNFKLTGTSTAVECEGNIMSLLNHKVSSASMGDDCFRELFKSCAKLTKAPELPATNLTYNCYNEMFSKCTALTSAPALPATTLNSSCYYCMFSDCTALTTAPELPATTLKMSCYFMMFSNCTALTTAPVLPATSVGFRSYAYMFYGCTSLTAAPALPATTLDSQCYSSMFYKCTSLTAAPALPATQVKDYCYDRMFEECSNLTSVGKIAATEISNTSALNRMFYNCSKLEVVETESTDEDKFITIESAGGTDAIKNMFYGCKVGSATAEAGKSYKCVVPSPYNGCIVGDFILKDGSILSKDTVLTEDQKAKVVAVVVREKNGDTPVLGIGIKESDTELAWCKQYAEDGTTELACYNTVISGLQVNRRNGSSVFETGYKNGVDSWEIVKAACSEAADHPEYFPAFNFCLTYGTTFGLTGKIANGWYLPTLAELKIVYDNKTVVNSSIEKAGGAQFDTFYVTCNLMDPEGEVEYNHCPYDVFASSGEDWDLLDRDRESVTVRALRVFK